MSSSSPSLEIGLIEEVLRLADGVRERVNRRRRHSKLVRDLEAFNTTCSAMDTVSDTCQALRAYFEHPPIPENDKGPAYLLVYGVLHALYLQQDAVFWWCKALRIRPIADHGSEGEWAGTLAELAAAREARNDSTGHPVRRRRTKARPLSSFFIVQSSLSARGFLLMGHDEHGSMTQRYIDLPALISGQLRALVAVLHLAGQARDADDRAHHEQFMDRPLTPIVNLMDYAISKLGASSGTDRVLMPGNVADIRLGLAKLQQAVEERQEPFDAHWEWEYRKLNRALQLLEDYGNGRGDVDGDLADVLGCYVRYAIDDLRQLTEEIDARYAGHEQ